MKSIFTFLILIFSLPVIALPMDSVTNYVAGYLTNNNIWIGTNSFSQVNGAGTVSNSQAVVGSQAATISSALQTIPSSATNQFVLTNLLTASGIFTPNGTNTINNLASAAGSVPSGLVTNGAPKEITVTGAGKTTTVFSNAVSTWGETNLSLTTSQFISTDANGGQASTVNGASLTNVPGTTLTGDSTVTLTPTKNSNGTSNFLLSANIALTNFTTSTLTNFTPVIGTVYTNNSGTFQVIDSVNVTFGEAAVAGMSTYQVRVTGIGGFTNGANQVTAIGGFSGSVTNTVGAFIVTNGGSWGVFDISTGIGNSVVLNGQCQITALGNYTVTTGANNAANFNTVSVGTVNITNAPVIKTNATGVSLTQLASSGIVSDSALTGNDAAMQLRYTTTATAQPASSNYFLITLSGTATSTSPLIVIPIANSDTNGNLTLANGTLNRLALFSVSSNSFGLGTCSSVPPISTSNRLAILIFRQ